MKRKAFKQLVAVLLTAACVISGCASNGGGTQTTGTQSGETTAGTQEQQAASTDGEVKTITILTAAEQFRSLRILWLHRYRRRRALKWSMLTAPAQ